MKTLLLKKITVIAIIAMALGSSYTLYADSPHNVFRDVPAVLTIRTVDNLVVEPPSDPPRPPPPRVAAIIVFSPPSISFNAVAGGENPAPQRLLVSTGRNRSVLRFNLSTDVTWLELGEDEGVSDATNDRQRIPISVDITGLDQGTYAGTITIKGRRADNDPQSVPVTLVLTGPDQRNRRTILENRNGQDVEITTDDESIQVVVPDGAISEEDSDGKEIEIELESVDVDSVPESDDDDTVIIRAIELHTIVDGEVTPIEYVEPVELSFFLTVEDLDLVEGNASRLGVVWFNEESESWESIPVTYEEDPEPAGRLVALLSHFSTYAVAVMGETSEPEPQPAPVDPTITPSPSIEPTETPVVEVSPTRIPSAEETETDNEVPTSTPFGSGGPPPTEVPPTFAPSPTFTPSPVVPTPTAIVVARGGEETPLPPPTPVVEFSTAVWLLIVGLAVAAGFGVVFQGLRIRRDGA